MSKTPSAFDPVVQHNNVPAKVVAALDRVGQAFRSLLWNETKTSGLSPIQIQLLIHLRFHPLSQSRVGDLARQFDLAAATISEALSTLVDKKLVEKRPDPEDGRARVLVLTAEGARVAEDLSSWATVVERFLSDGSEEDNVVVMRVLMGLIEQLQREGVVSVARMCSTCRHFERHGRTPDAGQHYCSLLDKPLATRDLRLDCPEHRPAA